MTALPFMASGSAARVPAAEVPPEPAVVYQFIFFDGPAWKTEPLFQPKSQPWLSCR